MKTERKGGRERMAYKVLAVGYNRNEYEIICPKLLKKNVATDLSETTQKAQCLLKEKVMIGPFFIPEY